MITLKQLREVANLSQLEVAYRANISSSRLSNFENSIGSLTDDEQERVRKGIVAMAKDRAKWTAARAKRITEAVPSRIVELTESSRSNSRANPKKYSELTEAERFDRRKALLRAGGASESEASIGAGISSDVRGVPRQFRGPKNGH